VGLVVFHTTPGSPEHELVNMRWFALFLAGMVAYEWREGGWRWRHAGLLALVACDVLRHNVWAPDSKFVNWEMVRVDVISFALLVAATWRVGSGQWTVGIGGRIWGAALRVVAWFGTISYCLYLMHQNIGYVVIRELSARGANVNWAIAGAMVVAVGLASAVTFGVERPVCAWARRVVKGRREGRLGPR
jgi:peptidoglycan/LPS O-acetylase OafA/YrhL